MMTTYHDLMVEIKNTRNEQELLKVVKFIDSNSKRLKLDNYQLDKLEAAGLKRYEEMTIERSQLIKNRK
jgi:hypothetical protein